MMSPGSKNWITKYFSLINQGEISLSFQLSEEENTKKLHAEFFKTGIIFGYPGEMLFSGHIDRSAWTMDEQIAVLLFESLIKTYLNNKKSWSEDDFLTSTLAFYKTYKEKNSFNLFSYFSKETNATKLENIVNERIHIRRKWSNILWVSHLNNSLIFLDIIAYKNFLEQGEVLEGVYKDFAHSAITTIVLAGYSNGQIESQEATIFDNTAI